MSDGLRTALAEPGAFSRVVLPKRALRGYQAGPGQAIAGAVLDRRRGLAGAGEFGVVFSRQSGKDELLAQLLCYLLVLFHKAGGSVVVVLPTLRPQGVIARDRLTERLSSPRLRALAGRARLRDGSIVELGRASVRFLSAAPGANARGNTASLLLVCNEAQDVEPDRWDAVFAPMAAAENAVTLMLGTVWTADTLLARQMRYLESLQAADGRQRLFLAPWRAVAQELPTYGRYVEGRIAELGAEHPFVKTEYELVELDGEGGLFPASRRGQMRGEHGPLEHGRPGETYALLLDVAGEEEDQVEGVQTFDPSARRDATALTVVRVRADAGLPGKQNRPVYEVVRRYGWTGVKHTALYGQLLDLARNVWRARYVVVDATGVGAGLASFLRSALGERTVLPFTFSLASKSQLGWDYLGIIDSGRFKEYDLTLSDPEAGNLAEVFWRQVAACTYAVRPGPGRLMSWSVPDPKTHDDFLLSAALVGVLDEQDWRPRTAVGYAA
ncbi:MAG TPA: hypothetical protein VFI42_10820 [Thermomicrobiaceae bacterium]|nr:hypothetical protein [Thermomicrobiaceae bacterium]